MPVHQLLVYPVTSHAMNTKSYEENEQGPILTKPMMAWFWGPYLKSSADGQSPYIAPLQANTDGLPPATVITAGFDVLRDEGAAYAEKLRGSGVKVEYRNYPGMGHEFFGMGAVVDEAKNATKAAGSSLKYSFQR